MKTYKTFRNVTQVINEVQGIAFDVAQVSGSHLPISDSKIDADLLRKSSEYEREKGITIFVREFGTQYANAWEVAKVRAAWGVQIVRTIEIKKERGGLWVVALDCLTRYDNKGEAIPQTDEQIKADAKQAEAVAHMAKTEAVITGNPCHIKAAELAQEEAERLRTKAIKIEIAEDYAQRKAQREAREAQKTTEAENDSEQDNTPQGTEDSTTEDENAPRFENIKAKVRKAAQMAKGATSKAVGVAAVALCICIGFGAFIGCVLFSAYLEDVAGVALADWVRFPLVLVLMFTAFIDVAAWAELNALALFDRLHLFEGIGGLYDRPQFLAHPVSMLGVMVRNLRQA